MALPPALLDRNSPEFAELLGDYFHADSSGSSLACTHGLTLIQLIAWKQTPVAQQALADILTFERERAHDLACRVASASVQLLTNLLTSAPNPESARKAASLLIRLALRPNSAPPPKPPAATPPAFSPPPLSPPLSPPSTCVEASTLSSQLPAAITIRPANTRPARSPLAPSAASAIQTLKSDVSAPTPSNPAVPPPVSRPPTPDASRSLPISRSTPSTHHIPTAPENGTVRERATARAPPETRPHPGATARQRQSLSASSSAASA